MDEQIILWELWAYWILALEKYHVFSFSIDFFLQPIPSTFTDKGVMYVGTVQVPGTTVVYGTVYSTPSIVGASSPFPFFSLPKTNTVVKLDFFTP